MNPYFVKDLAAQHRRELLSAGAARRGVEGDSLGRTRTRRRLTALFTERRHVAAPLAMWRRRAALTSGW
ncbi:MAG: hypothetical protein M0004_14650 [Actinomycetota bacterium]|nr:hypothetical protein [Actinomycetota bacterium]